MTRGTILHLHRDEVISRGFSQISCVPKPPPNSPDDAGNRAIVYRLEGGFNGDTDPNASHCASWSYGNRTPTADCVGFTLWSSGIDRCQPGYKGSRDEWLNCQSLIDDADGESIYCRNVLNKDALPGDWLVTPDHIALIIRPSVVGSDVLVIDCSPRHGWVQSINTGLPWSQACHVLRPNFYLD